MNNELINRIVSSIILIPLVIFFVVKGTYFFNFFILICFLISVYEWNLMTKNKQYKLPGIIFLSLSFYTAYYLRMQTYEGYTYFITIILICITSDIGGYVFGKILKGPKLTKISPNKTYAGVFGSFLLSLIAGLIYINYFDKKEIIDSDLVSIFLTILFISLISQIGDLVISYFKRKAKLKDTGKLLPGHGGLLDRIDGLIFVFPALFILVLIIELIK